MNTPTLPEALQRRPGEPTRAHTALIDYVRLGPGRSLEKLENQYRNDPGSIHVPSRQRTTIGDWSVRWEWVDRATAYDEQLAADRLAEDDRKWRERREAHREEAWNLAQRLFERAKELLAFPVADVTIETSRTESDDGKKVTIINQIFKPARWAQRDIPTLVLIYDKVARLALGMDTEQQRLTIEGLMPQDLDSLSDEELDRLEKELAKKGRR